MARKNTQTSLRNLAEIRRKSAALTPGSSNTDSNILVAIKNDIDSLIDFLKGKNKQNTSNKENDNIKKEKYSNKKIETKKNNENNKVFSDILEGILGVQNVCMYIASNLANKNLKRENFKKEYAYTPKGTNIAFNNRMYDVAKYSTWFKDFLYTPSTSSTSSNFDDSNILSALDRIEYPLNKIYDYISSTEYLNKINIVAGTVDIGKSSISDLALSINESINKNKESSVIKQPQQSIDTSNIVIEIAKDSIDTFNSIGNLLTSLGKNYSKNSDSIFMLRDFFDTLENIIDNFGNEDDIKKLDKTINNIIEPKDGFISKIEILEDRIKNFETIDKKETLKLATISTLIQSILNIGEIDNEKYNQLVNTLSRMIKLTNPSSVFGSIIKDGSGTIQRLLNNIVALGKSVSSNGNSSPSSSILALSSFLKSIVEISSNSIKENDIEDLEDKILTVVGLYGTDGPYEKLVNAINEFVNRINDSSTQQKSIIDFISKVLKEVNEISEDISLRAMLKINTAIIGFIGMAQELTIASKIAENLERNNGKGAQVIYSLVDSISLILENLNDATKNVPSLRKITKGFICISTIKGFALEMIATAFVAKIANNNVNNITTFLTNINTIIDALDNVSDSSKSKNKIQDIIEIIVGLTTISSMSALSLPALILGLPGLYVMKLSISAISTLVDNINDLNKLDDDTMSKMKSLLAVIGISSLIMVAGALAGNVVLKNFGALMAFTGTLSLFILGIVSAYNIGTDGLDDANLNANKFMSIVGFSAGIMFIGGMFFTLSPEIVPGIALFTATLFGFIISLGKCYELVGKMLKDDIKNLQTFEKLVIGSAIVMMIGATFIDGNKAIKSLAFGLTLIAFTSLISVGYRLATILMGKKAIHSMEEFNKLVVVCAGTLMIGALFMMIPGLWQSAIAFGLELSVFIAMIGGSYVLITKFGGKKMITSMKEFSKLILVCAGTLLIGGLFMYIPGMADNVLHFAELLGGFIVGVSIAYALATKFMSAKVIATAVALCALVAVSSIMLLIAGTMMIKYPGLGTAIGYFLLLDLGMIVGMMLILSVIVAGIKSGLLDLKTLGMTFLVMAGILGVIYASTLIMDCIIDGALRMRGKWDDMNKYIDNMTGVLWSFIKMVGAIVALIAVGGVFGAALGGGSGGFLIGAAVVAGIIATAEAAMLGIIKLVELSAKATGEIAISMKLWKSVGTFNFDDVKDKLVAYLGLMGVLTAAASGGLMMTALMSASYNIHLMAGAISDIAGIVQSIANMTIPIYDENGKEAGKRTMSPEEIKKAGQNIKDIVTCLGSAIVSLYENDKKGIFGNFLNSFMNVDTPFTRVCKSCNNMGVMISSIAEGVKDMATLTVPIYKGTKKVGYRSLKEEDFTLAKDNVSKIVTTLGNAIIDVYERNPNMFEDKSFWSWITGTPRPSKTKFGIVMTACTAMGKMISEITKGLKDLADLKIPIYKGTDIVGYHTIRTADFNKVNENISLIITSLATAIVDAYKKGQSGSVNLFEDPSSWYVPGNKSPIAMALKTFKGIGEAVSSMTNALTSIVNMKMPIFGKNGKVVGYRSINPSDFSPKGKLGSVLRYVIEALPSAVIKIYDDHVKDNWWTETGFWSPKSKFSIVKKSLSGIGNIVVEQVKALQSILNLKVIDKKTLQEKISTIMNAAPNALMESMWIVGKNGKLIENKILTDGDITENLGTIYSQIDDAIENAVTGYNKIIELLNKKVNDKQVDISNVSFTLKEVVSALPNIMYDITQGNGMDEEKKKAMKNLLSDTSFASSMTEVYSSYSDAVQYMVNVYSNVKKMLTDLTEKESKKTVSTSTIASPLVEIRNAIDTMMKSVLTSTTTFTEDDISFLTSSFVLCMQNYSTGIGYLKEVFKDFPEISKDAGSNLQNVMSKLNAEISNISDDKVVTFADESNSLDGFVKAVNDIDITKANTMIRMINSIEKMAMKIGNLDQLTKTLSHDLAEVLDHLTSELRKSASTIATAEKIQKDRHKAIQDSIKEVNTLLNNPVNVIVSQEDQTNTNDDSMPDSQSSPNSYTPASASSRPTSGSKYSFSIAEQNANENIIESIWKKLTKGSTSGQKTPAPAPSKSNNNTNGKK